MTEPDFVSDERSASKPGAPREAGAGFERAEPESAAVETGDTCVNCGAVLSGAYCHACGQIARSRIKMFRELVADVASDTFAYDSRMWRTLRRLVTSPGFLSREYVLGRRVRYTPPFRLYLVLSVILFVTLSAVFDRIDFTSPDEVVAELEATLPDLPELEGGEGWLERQQITFHRNAMLVAADPGPMLRNLVGMLPQMMFVLLPLLAAGS